jgi:N-acyl-D-amino-acid deacylase
VARYPEPRCHADRPTFGASCSSWLAIIYNPDTVDCLDQERLFDYPAGEWRLVQEATGYDRIIVNGEATFIDGKCTDATPGQLLRHGAA